jgi:diaminohydroxyphosphoribosylaminopyrimidine deaminase/5-amino-6-(5-phosphoribosylamino)uracil reductase
MRRALAQARRASGRTWPNPPVGAVVLRGDRVLGQGCTRPAGQEHAEIVALRAAARRHGDRAVRGATLAVTLEPCSHQGRTPACAPAVVAAGIRRVWVGERDPNPRVRGRGLAKLRRAGVEIREGVLAEACRAQHRGFRSWVERGRPHVALKLAATLDGRIATRSGESRWIGSPESRALVHRLRDGVDAVMVGSATAVADDPALTVRRPGRAARERAPVRVLVDSSLKVPATARLYTDPFAEQTWVLTAARHAGRHFAARAGAGARALAVATRGGHVEMGAALTCLGEAGLTHVLVEGGGGLAAALLEARLVDELHWFVAPSLLGGDARPALGPLRIDALRDAPGLQDLRVRRIGPDLYLHAMLESS